MVPATSLAGLFEFGTIALIWHGNFLLAELRSNVTKHNTEFTIWTSSRNSFRKTRILTTTSLQVTRGVTMEQNESDIRSRWSKLVGPITQEERKISRVGSKLVIANEFQISQCGNRISPITLEVDVIDHVPGKIALPNIPPRGIIIAGHQTTQPTSIGTAEPFGLDGDHELAYADELASRGHIVLGLDYPGFGLYRPNLYELNYQSVSARAIWHHTCLIESALSEWPRFKEKLGFIGHSLGGVNALFFSAFSDCRLAVVCSAGISSWKEFAKRHGSLDRWARADKYLPLIEQEYGCDPSSLPVTFGELAHLIQPSHLFVSAPKHDEIFPLSGAQEVLNEFERIFDGYGLDDHLSTMFPKCNHAFPTKIREQAYRFIEDAWDSKGHRASNL